MQSLSRSHDETGRAEGAQRAVGRTGWLLFLLLALVTAQPLAAAAAGSAVERLRQGETLSCASAYRVFCANIHFSCTGHSKIRARPLSIAVAEGVAVLAPREPEHADEVAPRRGAATFGTEAAYLLVRFEPEKGYFKVEADGRYSHRIYRNGRALMTKGTCK